jgi:GlcNAc-P-P-Und epimerase
MRTILLTGCNGYIGRSLVPHLKRQGATIIGVDRRPCAGDAIDRFIEGDLRDDKLLAELPGEIDMICHLAAAKDDWGQSDQEYFDDNLEATRGLLEAGTRRGVRDWLFYSSVAVLGPSSAALDETSPPAPRDAYGRSKAEAEALFSRWAAEEPAARITVIRPSVVFGPGHPSNTNIHRLIEALYHNRFLMVGKGDAIKTTSHLDNLIAVTVFLLERMRPGVQTFIYVDEPKLTTLKMVEMICHELGKKPPAWSIPLPIAAPIARLADLAAAVTRMDLPITAARIEKFNRPTNFSSTAVRELGFVQPVSMDEAVRRTVRWHLDGGGRGKQVPDPRAR